MDCALESRGLVCQREPKLAVLKGASGSWPQRKSLKAKIFVSVWSLLLRQ